MNGSNFAPCQPSGVYYAPEDVAGFARRILVVAVDLFVVLVLCLPFIGLDAAVGFPPWGANACIFTVGWVYLAGLKSTRFGTVGYRFLNVQLVDLRGERPGLWRCTCRFLVLFAAPANFLDLIWLSHDPDRQTLRDKIMGTYVIRRRARPLGSGPITYPTYFVGGLTFVFPEVSRVHAGDQSRPA